jgi:DNA processing protein
VVSLTSDASGGSAGILMIGVGTGRPSASPAGAAPEGRADGAMESASDTRGPHAAPATDPYARERDAWTVLTCAHGLGPIGFAALLARFGTGRAIVEIAGGPSGVERLTATPSLHPDRDHGPIHPSVARAIVSAVERSDQTLARVRDLGVRVLTVEEPAYPIRLASVAMPPHVLFVTGDPAALSPERAVAIVGTRRATTGGRTTAGRIATALVAADATIVSGLAFGIDGAAHEATVRAGGTTVAVIGGGHAVVAPRAHARLAAAIIAGGGAVVSELPPDVKPSRGTFPRRNRIISGLSDATVVVEAPARSGALITASWALEQGRPCYLVPGALDAPASAGCLAFLREWEPEAHLVAGIPQLIADLGFARPNSALRDAVAAATSQSLGTVEGAIAAELVAGRVTVDELVAATDLPVATVLTALVLLEGRGLAVGIHGRYRPSGSLLGEPVRIKLR